MTVSMKSTKQEILDALKEAKAELARRDAVIADPTQAKRKDEEDKCITNAAKDVSANIFSEEMNEKYTNLSNAILLLQNRLKEQYDIEEGLLNLVTVTNAAKTLQFQLDETYAKCKRDLDDELKMLQVRNEEAAQAMQNDIATQKRQAEMEAQRNYEEYVYNRDRERKIEQDKHDDAMAEAQKQLDEVLAKAAAIKAENEARLAEIDEMQKKIDNMPDALQEQYDIGYAEGEKAAGKEYGYKKAMAEKDNDYQVRELKNQIDRLNAALDEKTEKVGILEDKLDAAYEQIRELATKTVESNGSIKVIGGSADNSGKR